MNPALTQIEHIEKLVSFFRTVFDVLYDLEDPACLCDVATWDFIEMVRHLASELDIQAHWTSPKALHGYPAIAEDHCVALIDDVIFMDWTARQYGTAPYPMYGLLMGPGSVF